MRYASLSFCGQLLGKRQQNAVHQRLSTCISPCAQFTDRLKPCPSSKVFRGTRLATNGGRIAPPPNFSPTHHPHYRSTLPAATAHGRRPYHGPGAGCRCSNTPTLGSPRTQLHSQRRPQLQIPARRTQRPPARPRNLATRSRLRRPPTGSPLRRHYTGRNDFVSSRPSSHTPIGLLSLPSNPIHTPADLPHKTAFLVKGPTNERSHPAGPLHINKPARDYTMIPARLSPSPTQHAGEAGDAPTSVSSQQPQTLERMGPREGPTSYVNPPLRTWATESPLAG